MKIRFLAGWLLACGCLLPVRAAENTRAADLAKALREVTFDPERCYKVRDLSFIREDLKIYLNDGYLMFARELQGRKRAAVFSAEGEGDGEVLLMPAYRGERASLASFTGTPNLAEHIRAGIFVFSDDTADELMESLSRNGPPKVNSEMGLVLAPRWNPILSSFLTSLQIRLVEDGLAPHNPARGFFYAALNGLKVGNFDMLYDPMAREQITVGQVVFRDDRSFFDVWSSFPARSYRNGTRQVQKPPYQASDISIQATLDANLHLKATTRVTIKTTAPVEGSLEFEISNRVRVSAARVDGEAAEAFQRESLRASLVRGGENDVFLVTLPHPLEAGKTYQVDFEHEGDVITDAGNRVYFVGSRGTWYPRPPNDFASYDLTFRYPRDLTLVATGDLMEDRVEGEQRVSRHRAATPIRFAGFNLGVYDKVTAKAGPYTVEVYANHHAEANLQQRGPDSVPLAPPWGRRTSPGERPGGLGLPPVVRDPQQRQRDIAGDVAAAVEFMSTQFGPPPLKTLMVSPIPGNFGQGFPGLVYLSTMSYLIPEQRPAPYREPRMVFFYNEALPPHEAAHQWWGNLVVGAAYQDEWIMEALANYSALMFIEKRRGSKVMENALDQFRRNLLVKTSKGEEIDSVGPIMWGTRLARSEAPEAWRTITYDKGAWIIHMLRRRLGDERFIAMLRGLRKDFEYQPLSAEQFRAYAARYLPPKSGDPKLEEFFEQWVQSTGIPSLKLSYAVKGKAPSLHVTGTVSQSDVSDDFSAWVPVTIQFARGKPQVEWVRTGADPASFSFTVKQVPLRVTIDTTGVLSR